MLWFCMILIQLIKGGEGAFLVEPLALTNVLDQLKDEVLGVKRMQTFFDNAKFVREKVDGKRELDVLANILRQRFHDKIFAVEKIKTTVENAYSKQQVSASPIYPECCEVNPTKTDYRFKAKVFDDKVCELHAKYPSKGVKYLPKNLEKTMIENLNKDPDLRWQYFGSQEGILWLYPAIKYSSCDSYDNRIRPWYVEGIAPEPKDIVLIIDKSGSMDDIVGSKSLIEIAVSSAESVLNSLNFNDRVGIVAFSDSAETPPGEDSTSTCYSEQLTTAVGVNLEYLTKYLRNIKTGGETFYAQALQKAFALLKTNSTDVNDDLRKKVILFLTDGKPTDTINITAVLQQEKRSLKLATSKDVVIFAYGIGSHDFSLLRKLAEETEAEGTKGRFTEITFSDLDQLRLVFSSFYNFFAKTTKHSSHYISAPYFDASGLGEMVTIFIPCFHQQKVIGVAATDVPFSDLTSEVSLFEGGRSYAFIIDRKTGNVIIHPYMPRLQNGNDHPVILHITALEQEPEFKDFILESMIRGDEGSRTFINKRYLRSGSYSGVKVLDVNSTYYWKPIEATTLSLCIVVAEDETESRLETVSTSNPNSMLYHLELSVNNTYNDDDVEVCSLHGLRGTKDRAVVKFSGQCFEKPYDYTNLEETKTTIDAFKNYVKYGRSNPEPKFRAGVREMTVAGLEAELIWDKDISKFEDYTSFLRYASTNGVIFLKPGVTINKVYDPTKTLWFQNAVNNKDKMTLTTPYLDPFGAGLMVDIVNTLYEGKSSGQHDTSDEVVAVLGASFDIFRFHRLITEVYPKCREKYRCFIMDKSGLLIMHNHFVDFETVSDLKTLAKSIGNAHITQFEKTVAEDMIRRKLLYRKKCKDLRDITNDNFYEVNVSVNIQITNECPKYQITPFEGTTAYLGVVDNDCSYTSGRCFCPRTIYNTHLDDECVCPFKSTLHEYDYCKNHFPPSKTPLCPVSSPLLPSTDGFSGHSEDLKNCFDENCEGEVGEEDCYDLRSCTWCVYSKSKSVRLEKPFCTSSELCYGGVQGNNQSVLYPGIRSGNKERNSTKTDVEREESNDDGNLLVVILAPILIVTAIIIVTVTAIWCKYFRNRNNNGVMRNEGHIDSMEGHHEGHQNGAYVTRGFQLTDGN